MGLGPIMAIYQARFMKYLAGREVADTAGRKVWAFLGDGETDEPESLGAISLAGRERLDNLIFVINCNLQRLDGPVRGNGKIIQELETVFRGSGWNVIKVVWGSRWDELLARDHDGLLLARMEEAVDGDYQTYKSRDGAYVREHFFGTSPELRAMVADMSDEEIWALNRGGLDPRKVHAAYKAAVEHTGQPTVILAKTIKGYGMGEAGEGQNITHQQKKMTEQALLAFRDRFGLPLSDEQVRDMSLYRPPEDSPEMTFLRERRAALGGSLPARRTRADALPVPELSAFESQLTGTGDREVSTTMAFVRVLSTLLRDKRIGRHVVPIVPDESRTFGMEGMFRQLGIFSQVGQLYTPEDSEQLMFYREDKKGQVLQEGINEAGAFSSWIAASTSYSNHGVPMIPFYIFYSMFGFQRIGDLAWAAGDSRARGFLLGGTAGPHDAQRRGPAARGRPQPPAVRDDPQLRLLRPDVRLRGRGDRAGGPAPHARRAGGRLLLPHADERELPPPGHARGRAGGHPAQACTAWRRPSRPTARRECGCWARARSCARCSPPPSCCARIGACRPTSTASRASPSCGAREWRSSAGTSCTPERSRGAPGWRATLEVGDGPVVAATDYMRAFADQIRPWVRAPYRVLGTDGFGRSDYRKALRAFFEVDRHHVALAALTSLAAEGAVDAAVPGKAIRSYGIDPERPAPWRV